jgi:outer membrane protein TolC
MAMRRPVGALGAGAVLAVALGGCTIGSDFLRPGTPAGAGYTPEKLSSATAAADVPGGAAQRFVEAEDIPGQWWTLFHSASLNAPIDEALEANPDLAAALRTL